MMFRRRYSSWSNFGSCGWSLRVGITGPIRRRLEHRQMRGYQLNSPLAEPGRRVVTHLRGSAEIAGCSARNMAGAVCPVCWARPAADGLHCARTHTHTERRAGGRRPMVSLQRCSVAAHPDPLHCMHCSATVTRHNGLPRHCATMVCRRGSKG
jgi:hypothetical protein